MTEEQHQDQTRYGMRVECQVWSRIVGYLRPTRDWNKSKKDEFAKRKTYDVPTTEQLKEDDNGCACS